MDTDDLRDYAEEAYNRAFCPGCGCSPCEHRCAEPAVAIGRLEHEPCQRGTEGCSVDHEGDEPCAPW